MQESPYLEALRKLNKSATIKEVLELNRLDAELLGNLMNETSRDVKDLEKIGLKYLKKALEGTFCWSVKQADRMKEIFETFAEVDGVHFREFANSSFFRYCFTLEGLCQLTRVKFGHVGGEYYDSAIRAISQIMKFKVNFFIVPLLTFKPSIKASTLGLTDPFYRQRVRRQNREDRDIQEQLLSSSFDLKSYVFSMIEVFFPRVGRRWIGSNQFAHVLLLKMFLMLFEYGLFPFEELEEAIVIIFNITDILTELENSILKDSIAKHHSPKVQNIWTQICIKCRKRVAAILLHMLALWFDNEAERGLKTTLTPPLRSFASKLKNLRKPFFLRDLSPEQIFHYKRWRMKSFNVYFGCILSTFLKREVKFPEATTAITSRKLDELFGLLLRYSSCGDNDFFLNSLRMTSPEAVRLYLADDKFMISPKQKAALDSLDALLEDIKAGGLVWLEQELDGDEFSSETPLPRPKFSILKTQASAMVPELQSFQNKRSGSNAEESLNSHNRSFIHASSGLLGALPQSSFETGKRDNDTSQPSADGTDERVLRVKRRLEAVLNGLSSAAEETHQTEAINAFSQFIALRSVHLKLLVVYDALLEVEEKVMSISKLVGTLGARTLVRMVSRSSVTLTTLFSKFGIYHFQLLMLKESNTCCRILMEIFQMPESAVQVERNPEIRRLLLNTFSQQVSRFFAQFKDGTDMNFIRWDWANVSGLIYMCRTLRFVLRHATEISLGLALEFSQLLSGYVEVLCRFLFKCEYLGSQQDITMRHYKNPENFNQLRDIWSTMLNSDRSVPLFEIIYQLLKLLAASTENVYSMKTVKALSPSLLVAFSQANTEKLFLTEDTLRIAKAFMRLLKNVGILPQNHVLDRQELINWSKQPPAEEFIKPEDYSVARAKLLELLIGQVTASLRSYGSKQKFAFSSVMDSLFLIIFKIYSSILENLDPDFEELLFDGPMLALIQSIEELIDLAVLKGFGSLRDPEVPTGFLKHFIPLMDAGTLQIDGEDEQNEEQGVTIEVILCNLMRKIAVFYQNNEEVLNQMRSYFRKDLMEKEDETQEKLKQNLDSLMKFRSERNLHREVKIQWEKADRFTLALEIQKLHCMRKKTKSSKEGMTPRINQMNALLSAMVKPAYKPEIVMGKVATMKGVELLNQNISNFIQSFEFRAESYMVALSFIASRYRRMRIRLLDRPAENQLLNIFASSDSVKSNIEAFTEFFAKRMSSIDIDFSDPSQSYFAQKEISELLIFMDNLVRQKAVFRETLFRMLKTIPECSEFVQRLFRLHANLGSFLLFKTFIDKNWREAYVHFYVISNFIQNLCEDNFLEFKDWFFETPEKGRLQAVVAKNAPSPSLLLGYFSSLIIGFRRASVSMDGGHQNITGGSRTELFPVLNRMTEGFTEFINCGRCAGQLAIYNMGMEIWVKMVNQVVDEIDSGFYTLKLNVLLYLNALIGSDKKRVQRFIASCFSPQMLGELITRLIKKLFARYMIEKNSRKMFQRRGFVNRRPGSISRSQEDKYQISSVGELLSVYMRYERSFSDHAILNSVVQAYTFIRELGASQPDYRGYLKEMNAITSDFEKRSLSRRKIRPEHQPLIIWSFLWNIIVEIEVLYIEKGNKAEEKPKLIVNYFKKLPICFFLTEKVKADFIDSAPIYSVQTKHQAFFAKVPVLIANIRYWRSVCQNFNFFFQTSHENAYQILVHGSYCITLIINLLLVLTFDDLILSDGTRGFVSTNKLIIVLASFDTIAAVILLIQWLVFAYPNVRRCLWKGYFQVHSKYKPVSLGTWISINFIESTMSQVNFRFFVFKLVLGLAGLIANPFYLTLQLLLIMELQTTARFIAVSVVTNLDKLGFTLLMTIIFMTFYSLLAMSSFQGYLVDLVCDNYFECLVNTMNLGLRAGSGISAHLIHLYETEDDHYIGRLLFDVSFFVFVTVMMVGIFFGIIVDSFKALKEKLNRQLNDRQNVCFVCGLERQDLERVDVNFEKHLEFHELWKYFYYVVYLRFTPRNDYDGIDLFVDEHFHQGNNDSWMPVFRTAATEE